MNHVLKKCSSTPLCCLLLCILLFACQNKKHSIEPLNRAYTLVEDNPIEAIKTLDSIENPKGLPQKDYMSYLAIYVYAKSILKEPVVTDTIVYSAQRYFNSIKDYPQEATYANFSAGRVYFENNKYDLALDAFLNVDSYSDLLNNKIILAKSNYNIGYIYYQNEMFSDAVKHFEKALIIEDSLSNIDKLKANTMNYLGRAYEANKNLKESLETFSRLFDFAELTNDSANKGYANLNIGVVYLNDKKYKKSVEYSLKALPYTKSIEDSLRIYLNLATAYKGLNNVDSVSFYSNQLTERVSVITSPHTLKMVYQLLANFYKNAGDKGEALRYQELYNETTEQIESQKQTDKINKSGFEFALNKKEEDHRNEILRIKIIGACLIFIFFAYIFFVFHKYLYWRKKGIASDNIMKDLKIIQEEYGINPFNLYKIVYVYMKTNYETEREQELVERDLIKQIDELRK